MWPTSASVKRESSLDRCVPLPDAGRAAGPPPSLAAVCHARCWARLRDAFSLCPAHGRLRLVRLRLPDERCRASSSPACVRACVIGRRSSSASCLRRVADHASSICVPARAIVNLGRGASAAACTACKYRVPAGYGILEIAQTGQGTAFVFCRFAADGCAESVLGVRPRLRHGLRSRPGRDRAHTRRSPRARSQRSGGTGGSRDRLGAYSAVPRRCCCSSGPPFGEAYAA